MPFGNSVSGTIPFFISATANHHFPSFFAIAIESHWVPACAGAADILLFMIYIATRHSREGENHHAPE
ncbi:hypothetical protein [Photobacterium galatheae]|uniref:hypothetical protein n=1 Tax=Photobacterium galatheae TaxID=1654360 RepID=UPI000B149BED|nr:hypothetical protein [Photobacterium galatheae]